MLRPLLLLVLLGFGPALFAAEGGILKVLPHLLDSQGRKALSPSLFERDAYQAELRRNPALISGVRYDIHWQARRSASGLLRLRLQLRTSNRALDHPMELETPVKARFFQGGWAALSLTGDSYRQAGEVQAWRATLFDGATEVAESKSFLW